MPNRFQIENESSDRPIGGQAVSLEDLGRLIAGTVKPHSSFVRIDKLAEIHAIPPVLDHLLFQFRNAIARRL